MKYRKLGTTNLKISVIGLGTWQLGGEWNKTFTQPEVDHLFARAAELGINLIDTAECYGDHLSESLIGSAIAKNRGDWIIATKFGHKFNGNFHRLEPRTPADVVEQVNASLKALRTDYLDILQYHSWGDQQFDDLAVLEVLHSLQAAGKVHHLGNSVRGNQVDSSYQVAQSAERRIEVIQVAFNRLDRAPEEKIFPLCITQNLGVLARTPLASGYLSGKYKPGAKFSPDDARHKQDEQKRQAKLAEAQTIRQREVPPGLDMATWALAWCLQNPALTAVIPGCKDLKQLESNAAAADVGDFVKDDHPQAWPA
jgi:aryl-alcohol dehydrogenase-like predicted oxidoreductase